MSTTAQQIAQTSAQLLRELIMGNPEPPAGPPVPPLRRSTPQGHDGEPMHEEALREQAPMPELDGHEVLVPRPDGDGMEPAVVRDIIPLEGVRCRAQGERVLIDFVYCDDYPSEMFGPGQTVARVVTIPGDPRRELWIASCLQILRGHLGDDALAVEFDVEWVSGRWEDLLKDELTLPEG